MPLFALGISHKSAPLAIRERIVFPSERMGRALGRLAAVPGVSEAAILSTCNRTELYYEGEQSDSEPIITWLQAYHGLSQGELEPYLYQHLDQSAVRHVLRVATGLDSMVLGEPQILGQIKNAYQEARRAGTLGILLSRLFQHTFAVAKQVRTDTAIGTSPISVAFATVRLAQQIFGDLSQQTALLIGAGETIELAARHLHHKGLRRMIIANRSVERAHALAAEFSGFGVALAQMPTHIAQADIVISSTASPTPLLDKDSVARAIKQRKHRLVFMVDLAVPRDIDPEVGTLEDVYLYTIDDLQAVIQNNLRSREEAAMEAEEIIELEVSRFMAWLRARGAVDTIRSLRKYAESARDDVLAKALRRLRQGKDPEKVLKYVVHTLTNKFAHGPCVGLRKAGCEGRTELIDAVRELFELIDDNPSL
jgi:glutamyl-tRNA reductase